MSKSTTVLDSEWVNAFTILISKCLGYQPQDELLVIYDESVAPYLNALISSIDSLNVPASLLFFPQAFQHSLVESAATEAIKDRVDLPAGVTAGIAASTMIINLLDGHPSTALIRKTVNHTQRSHTCRLATIPGISSEILSLLTNSQFDDILRLSSDVAWLLGETNVVEIITSDAGGRNYALRFALGGWETEPIMSPGIFLPGSWGNVPPGETFCCPEPSTVNGSICVNGSVPGVVIENNEEIILTFSRGRMVDWQPSGNTRGAALAFIDREKFRASERNDRSWNIFAEFGVGLNPLIQKLTGNALFDEKAFNTIHIAIGDNSAFGDNIRSFIHADMVIKNPTVSLDGKFLFENGRYNSELIKALRARPFGLVVDILPADCTVSLRESKVGNYSGTFQRRLSKAHRVNYVRMTDDPEIALDLQMICEQLKIHGHIHLATFLKNAPPTKESTELLLGMLNHYKVLRLGQHRS